MSRIIVITVAPNGQTEVQTKGFSGSECRQASQLIEVTLGQRCGEQLTAEFYQQPSQPLPYQLKRGAH
ncbi:MAG: DUF2997 domain-containing protein [Planctomycetota bacterium]|jgi:hypothetical protein|nr:MAG: DUF2997 domain-containing protein [Planctomycetota bacterium]